MTSLTVRLLGPTVVELDRAAVRLTSQQRALVAMLALNGGRTVTVDRLVDGLWGEASPVSARNVIQVQISKLRAALGPLSALLTSEGPGYRLAERGVHLDVRRLGQLDGVSRDRPWDPADAVWTELRRLCEPAPLEDLREYPFADGIVPALEEQQLLLTERRLVAQVRSRDDTAVVELERLTTAFPYRERLTGLLMRAHQQAGRQADALAAFRRTRQILADELGLDPSLELQRLEQDVLASSVPDDPPPPVAKPRMAALRMTTWPLVGRASELVELQSSLREAPLVTLVGPGGVGKTRLAVEVAATMTDEFDDVVLVELADTTSANEAAAEVARALGVTVGRDAWAAIGDFVSSSRLLLVLDNVEQLAGIGVLIATLVRRAESARVLVTSRHPLHVRDERVRQIEPLPTEDAVELFLQRMTAAAPGRTSDPALVDRLCERLDRLPLAIELAAAGCRRMAPAELLQRLDVAEPPGLIEDLPARQRSLSANVGWSLDLLSTEAREVLAGLTVFAAAFTRDAAARVVGWREGDPLSELVDACLLVPDEDRLRMPQLVRREAARVLDHSGDAEVVRGRHADWVADLVPVVDEKGLKALLPEVLAALETCLRQQRAGLAADLLLAAAPGWQRLDDDLALSTMLVWLTAVLEARPDDPTTRTRLLLLRQDRLFRLGRDDECTRDTLAAHELAREHGDAWGQARACHALAYRAFLDGLLEGASSWCDEGERAAAQAGDDALLMRFRAVRGSVALATGDVDAAVAHSRAIVTSAAADQWSKSWAALEVVDALVSAERLDEAAVAMDVAWDLVPPLQDHPSAVIALLLGSCLALRRGDISECLRGLVAAGAAREPIAMRSDLVADVVVTGSALLRLGDRPAATALAALADVVTAALPAARMQYVSFEKVAAELRRDSTARERRGVLPALLDPGDWRQVAAQVAAVAGRALARSGTPVVSNLD